ncbi:MAG: 3-dehydroquinate dehydratase [Desulfovibrio sp.]|jgi:3-dehydroquinate dehydratase-2|nr:3-dehydroquinate dehydratase [Desulfovibrio sp.]
MTQDDNCGGAAQQPPEAPYSILVLNGPNLAHTGLRCPEIYGRRTLSDIPSLVETLLGERSAQVRLLFFQSNCEGELINRLEAARNEGIRGVVLNAGAYTHTGLALADCVQWIGIPVVEVHISNVFARKETIRRHSFLAPHSVGMIAGFGLMGYALAVQALYTRFTGSD